MKNMLFLSVILAFALTAVNMASADMKAEIEQSVIKVNATINLPEHCDGWERQEAIIVTAEQAVNDFEALTAYLEKVKFAGCREIQELKDAAMVKMEEGGNE